jgi:hypothetical protein
MPIYTYEDQEAGIKIDLRRPVEDRNKPIVLKRMKDIPDRVGVMVRGGHTEDTSFNSRILKSHYKQEQEQGSRFRSTYTKNQIKEAWSTP